MLQINKTRQIRWLNYTYRIFSIPCRKFLNTPHYLIQLILIAEYVQRSVIPKKHFDIKTMAPLPTKRTVGWSAIAKASGSQTHQTQ